MESCSDEKNTPYIRSDAFFEPAGLLMGEYGLSEANSPTEALLLFQEIYKRVVHAWHWYKMGILGEITVNFNFVDFNLASNSYFVTLCLIYNLTFRHIFQINY